MPRSDWARVTLKSKKRGFPGGAVVENLPDNTGGTGSSPGLGRSHVPRSNWAREPRLLSLRVWSLCSSAGEAAMAHEPQLLNLRVWSLCSATRKATIWTSLVAQWLRICLPMQGTRVRALVWEDPTCRGATRPVSHNC
ncbi:hypothetical protein J1605_004741 [Eschrichtius robustus]|uniref:Uncharacterized protein n=1 Tax=Eschrichtius robustus TaxID=9764 RepID=A0AB34HES5_ESCRO|nr:hypothetical protein J1605_004741 [Eschrichtius robustus]